MSRTTDQNNEESTPESTNLSRFTVTLADVVPLEEGEEYTPPDPYAPEE